MNNDERITTTKLQEHGLLATKQYNLSKSDIIFDNTSNNPPLSKSIYNQSTFINDVVIYNELIDKIYVPIH